MSGGDKKIVIYLDVLFGINLLMDLIVLYLVNKICKFAATFLRILLSATLGAVWSVIVAVSPNGINSFMLICTYVFISFLMIKICAFKRRLSELLKGVITLYGVTFVLAGAMHMLYYYTYAGYFIKTVILKDSSLLLFVGISLLLMYLVYVQYMRVKIYESKKCSVRICVGECEIMLSGLVDTGNVLKDPYSRKPISIAQKRSLQNVLKGINDYEKVKYHMVPFQSLGCENGLLEVITADIVYIYKDKKEIKITEALIGLTDIELSTDKAYQMLINPEVLG